MMSLRLKLPREIIEIVNDYSVGPRDYHRTNHAIVMAQLRLTLALMQGCAHLYTHRHVSRLFSQGGTPYRYTCLCCAECLSAVSLSI